MPIRLLLSVGEECMQTNEQLSCETAGLRTFQGEYLLARRPVKPKKRRAPTERAMHLLQSYPWLGNMLELQSAMERFAVFSEDNVHSIDAKWIPSPGSLQDSMRASQRMRILLSNCRD
jgi:transcriptional regulator of acetoin/glycerol metabolism